MSERIKDFLLFVLLLFSIVSIGTIVFSIISIFLMHYFELKVLVK